ncbi:MAG: carbon-nitrogen hydrolase family protein [Spirochaetia bacterium]|jgi:predicted amidohydrolase|nr:carbon-nitrogen hydrolase family protein [Spirochaetia bacterium]
MAGNFKLALIQMLVEGGRKEENLFHAEELIFRASEGGAQIALLPECMDLGWTHTSSQSEAEAIPDGKPYKRLSRTAKENNIYICAGLTESNGSKIFNSAVLINNKGELKLLHRKLNELDIGFDYYNPGDRLNVVETEFGVIGLMICADAFAEDQVLSRSLCYMGADVILSPSSWAVSNTKLYSEKNPYGEIWRKNYGPVSKKYKVWIAGVSNVGELTEGPWAGRTCIGSSLVFDPDGREVLQGPYGPDAEAIIYVDIKTEERPFRGHDWIKSEK